MHSHKPAHPYVSDSNLADFDEKVINHSHTTPVLVDFWAEWCSPCHVLAPNLIKAVEQQQGRVKLVKVDVDEG